MKLTIDGFLDIISWLSAYYTNFNFTPKIKDTNKPSAQSYVWYEIFKEFDEDTLMQTIKDYCLNNVYPPQSPTNILDYLYTKTLNDTLSGAEAFNKIIEWWADDNINNDQLIRNIADVNESLLQTFNDMRLSHIGRYAKITDDFTKNQLKKEFIETYEKNLKTFVRGIIQKGKVLLGDTSTLKIGSGDK